MPICKNARFFSARIYHVAFCFFFRTSPKHRETMDDEFAFFASEEPSVPLKSSLKQTSTATATAGSTDSTRHITFAHEHVEQAQGILSRHVLSAVCCKFEKKVQLSKRHKVWVHIGKDGPKVLTIGNEGELQMQVRVLGKVFPIDERRSLSLSYLNSQFDFLVDVEVLTGTHLSCDGHVILEEYDPTLHVHVSPPVDHLQAWMTAQRTAATTTTTSVTPPSPSLSSSLPSATAPPTSALLGETKGAKDDKESKGDDDNLTLLMVSDEALYKQMTLAQAESKSLSASLDKTAKQLEDAQKQIEETRRQWQQEVLTAQEHVRGSQQETSEAKRQVVETRHQLQDAQEQLKIAQQETSEAKRHLEETQRLLQEAKEQLQSAQAETSQVQQRYGQVRSDADCAREETKRIQEGLKVVREEFDIAQTQVKQSRQEQYDAQEQMLATQQQLQQVRADRSALEQLLQAAQAENARLNEQNQTLESQRQKEAPTHDLDTLPWAPETATGDHLHESDLSRADETKEPSQESKAAEDTTQQKAPHKEDDGKARAPESATDAELDETTDVQLAELSSRTDAERDKESPSGWTILLCMIISTLLLSIAATTLVWEGWVSVCWMGEACGCTFTDPNVANARAILLES